MKNKTKYLVAILLMLVSFLLIGATNVNATTTAEVNNYSDKAFLPGILKALNTPAETYDMAYSYLAIYILGYLAVYLLSLIHI